MSMPAMMQLMAAHATVARLEQEAADLRAGKCLGVIPLTFIACGEGGNYCSEACHLRSTLADRASEDNWRGIAESLRAQLADRNAEVDRLMGLLNGAAEVVAASTVIRRRHADVFTNLAPGSDTDNWVRAIDKFHGDTATTGDRSGK